VPAIGPYPKLDGYSKVRFEGALTAVEFNDWQESECTAEYWLMRRLSWLHKNWTLVQHFDVLLHCPYNMTLIFSYVGQQIYVWLKPQNVLIWTVSDAVVQNSLHWISLVCFALIVLLYKTLLEISFYHISVILQACSWSRNTNKHKREIWLSSGL
jgi:hypothetical protein